MLKKMTAFMLSALSVSVQAMDHDMLTVQREILDYYSEGSNFFYNTNLDRLAVAPPESTLVPDLDPWACIDVWSLHPIKKLCSIQLSALAKDKEHSNCLSYKNDMHEVRWIDNTKLERIKTNSLNFAYRCTAITEMIFSADSNLLYVQTNHAAVLVFDINTGTLKEYYDGPHISLVNPNLILYQGTLVGALYHQATESTAYIQYPINNQDKAFEVLRDQLFLKKISVSPAGYYLALLFHDTLLVYNCLDMQDFFVYKNFEFMSCDTLSWNDIQLPVPFDSSNTEIDARATQTILKLEQLSIGSPLRSEQFTWNSNKGLMRKPALSKQLSIEI